MIERASRRDRAEPFCDSIAELGALRRGQDVDSAGTEGVAVSFEAIEGAQHRANVAYESGDRERVILGLATSAREHEDPKVRRVTRHIWNGLRSNHALARGEMHGCRRIRAQPQRALEYEDIRGVRYDLGRAQRRQHAVLVGQRDGRARAQRSDR